jgi:hypothetical protein
VNVLEKLDYGQPEEPRPLLPLRLQVILVLLVGALVLAALAAAPIAWAYLSFRESQKTF